MPPVRDRDGRPYKQGSNIRLHHDEYGCQNETTGCSAKPLTLCCVDKQLREYRLGHLLDLEDVVNG